MAGDALRHLAQLVLGRHLLLGPLATQLFNRPMTEQSYL
jgi:hypothetical protein